MAFFQLVVLASAIVLLFSALPTRAAVKNITIGPTVGRFALLQGVDRGPSCDTPGASITNQLHIMRSNLIRTHDAVVLDWCVLFPNVTANPNDPASYVWTAGDAYFTQIVTAGFSPYFRVGSSWNIPAEFCIRPDPNLFATVAVRTIAHYNDGWAGGFTGKKIKFIEIGNEPDGPRFWNLSATDFYTLFDTTARALKAYDDSLIVGGPGVSNTLSQDSRPFAFGLLDFVSASGTPIDFYSWHYYGHDELNPEYNYFGTINKVRAYLASKGLGALAQHVTEWAGAILGTSNVTSSAMAATYVASALTYMAQAGDVEIATYYPGCEGVGSDGSWGLFEDVGNGTVLWRRQGYAYVAVGQTIQDTPFNQSVTFAPEEDYSVLAGANAANNPDRVSVVVSTQHQSALGYSGFTLAVKLGGSDSVNVSLLSLDDSSEGVQWMNATYTKDFDGYVRVTHSVSPPSVVWAIFQA